MSRYLEELDYLSLQITLVIVAIWGVLEIPQHERFLHIVGNSHGGTIQLKVTSPCNPYDI